MKRTSLFLLFLLLFHSSAFPQVFLGNYTSHYNEGKVAVIHADSSTVRFSFYTSEIIRVDYLPTSSSIAESSFVVIRDTSESLILSIIDNDSTLEISSSAVTVCCSKYPLRISFYNASHKILLAEPGSGGLGTNGDERLAIFSINADEHYYGTGERGIGLDLREKSFDSYNTQIGGYTTELPTMNLNVPFVCSSNGYALLFDNTYKGRFDIGDSEPAKFFYKASGGELTYYFIAAPTIPKQLELYTWLTGRQPLPPKWALGFIQSKYGYRNETEARTTVQTMRQKNIPCDAIVLDLYWFRYMGDLAWDYSAFPNPVQMIDDFIDDGIKTVLITEPYFTEYSTNWVPAGAAGYFVKDALGNPYIIQNWWSCGCDASLLDITNPETKNWFWSIYANHMGGNVAGFWTDLGEPENHNSDMLHYEGTAEKVHNIYNLLWSEIIMDGYTALKPDTRLFNLTRSGFAGSQRYGVTPWSGDVGKSFSALAVQIPMLLNMGMSGFAYHNSDIGGFCCGTTTPELYIRWMQYGTFCPVARAHGVGQPTEPWGYGPEAENISKKFIELRYQLIPYIYTMAYDNYTTGMPLARPLFFDYPDDINLPNESSSYLWGDAFLVSPVVQQSQRNKNVYLPAGKWINYWTDQITDGGRTVNVSAPLDELPIFVKAGSIIPMQAIMNYTDERPLDTLYLAIYPSAVETGQFTLYEDDGKTLQYMTGSFAQTTFTQSITDTVLSISIGPSVGSYTGKIMNRVYISEIHNIIQGQGHVSANGQILPERFTYEDLRQNGGGYYYDSLKNRLYIQTLTAADSNYLIIASDIRMTGVNNMDSGMPESYGIDQNYPNPFNPATTIGYSLPVESRVSLRIYNVLGQAVATIKEGVQNAGLKSVEWNAGAAPSGIYLCRLEAASVMKPVKVFTQVRKMILIR